MQRPWERRDANARRPDRPTSGPTPRRAPGRAGSIAAATILLALALAIPGGAAPAAAAVTVVDPPPPVLDCADWRYGPADEPASLPPEYDRNDYKRTSWRDPRPALSTSPQNQCGQKGAAVDLAWGLSTGTPDVV